MNQSKIQKMVAGWEIIRKQYPDDYIDRIINIYDIKPMTEINIIFKKYLLARGKFNNFNN